MNRIRRLENNNYDIISMKLSILVLMILKNCLEKPVFTMQNNF